MSQEKRFTPFLWLGMAATVMDFSYWHLLFFVSNRDPDLDDGAGLAMALFFPFMLLAWVAAAFGVSSIPSRPPRYPTLAAFIAFPLLLASICRSRCAACAIWY